MATLEEKAPSEAAAEEGEAVGEAVAADPVKAMVAKAFEGAVATASRATDGSADDQAEDEDGEGERGQGQQQHQIRVTRDMHQALFLVNNLLVGMPDDNPSFLLNMNPDRFEEDLYAAIESRHPEEMGTLPVSQFAQILAPLCRQLHDVAAASRGGNGAAGAKKAQASEGAGSSNQAGAAGSAGAGTSEGAAASGSGTGALTRPRLPARASRSDAGSTAGGSARGPSRTSSAEAWTDLCGPNDAEDVKEYRMKLQQLREDMCRMYLKIGAPMSTLHLRQTLHRLKVSEMQVAPFSPTRPNMDDKAKAAAQQKEQSGEPLKSRLVVAVIGLSGSGKTSLINRLLDLPPVDPFEGGTKKCRVVDGEARGIPVRFIDSPGLELGFHAQQTNRFKMIGLRRMCAKKGNRPHVYLYVDRMDTARKQETDISLLTSVYSVLGRERLYSTIGVLTYASTKPPDSRNGPLEYEAWSTPRIRSLQFAMMATANDRTAQYIIAPAENHPRCRVADGEPVLPSGVRWISNLLGIMSMFMGLSSATDLPKPKSLAKKAAGPSTASMDIRRLFAGNAEKQVPVTYILQQFNQAKSVHKLPDEERAILSAGEIARMKETKHEQAREEQRKRREYMKMREEEARSPEPIVPTLAPDPPLPPVFDALQSTYLYRYNENQAGWIARPFLDSNGPDRSDGINGGQAERTGTLRLPSQYIGGAPSRVMLQAVKDKNSMVLICQSDTSASIGRDNVLTASFDTQTLSGGAVMYTVRLEPRIKYGEIAGRKRFKTAIGLLNTRVAEDFNPRKGPVAKGIRLEQRLRITDGLKIIGTHVGMMGGTSNMRERGRAFGLEATFKPKGSIEGRELMVGWNTMRTQRLALSGRDLGGNQVNGGTLAMVQHLSPETVLNGRVQMNGNGQSTLSVRITSHDKMSMRWAYLMPVVGWLLDKLTKRSNEPADF